MTSLRLAGLAAVTAAALLSSALPSAAEFFGWRVSGVPAWDILNVRKYPSSSSQILVGYPNNTPLSLTGSCTGGLNLNNINGWPKWKQAQAVRYLWCQAWVDPTG